DLYIADKSAPSGSRSRRRSKFGEPLAAATVANHVILLRRVLSVAHRWELIDRVPPVTCPVAATPRTDFLTFEEAERVVAAAAPEWRVLIHLAVRTGLRLGELRGLRWCDLHLDVGYLRVEQNLTKAGYGAPKSGRARTVDLAADAREALRGHPRTPNREDLVFSQPGGQPVTEGQVYRAVQAAAQRAGIRRKVHPHLLRHTFASHCVMRGIPLAVVKEWLGHAESRMTERYAHLAPEVKAGYIDRLASPANAASAASHGPATGTRDNGPENLPASRGNIGATATAPERKTPPRVS
ncbi:MAG TPA: tyrosine-type recombinase/integrase, partial [Nannocystaceae bacterium]|nr:tyrosine-type recombinase/integrase [Nannocystaceae bacterium]